MKLCQERFKLNIRNFFFLAPSLPYFIFIFGQCTQAHGGTGPVQGQKQELNDLCGPLPDQDIPYLPTSTPRYPYLLTVMLHPCGTRKYTGHLTQPGTLLILLPTPLRKEGIPWHGPPPGN